jgi:uncharacterized membrane protein
MKYILRREIYFFQKGLKSFDDFLFIMAKKKVKRDSRNRFEKKSSSRDNRQLFAFIATFFTLIGFIIALILKRDDKYVMFYAKQGLVLFIGFVIAGFVGKLPVIGWIYSVFIVVLWILAWINALSGEERNTFIVGDIAEKIKL